jgi:hypothetical protein
LGGATVVRLAVLYSVFWLLSPNSVRAADLSPLSANDISATVFDDIQPAARVHAARIFLDHEKFGFFRLGVAPLVAIQGVRLQVRSARDLTNVPALFEAWNPPARRPLPMEMREFQLSLFGEGEPRLRASTARLRDFSTLEVSKVWLAGTAPVSISKATLLLAGPRAGILHWNDGGRQSELTVFNPPEKLSP